MTGGLGFPDSVLIANTATLTVALCPQVPSHA